MVEINFTGLGQIDRPAGPTAARPPIRVLLVLTGLAMGGATNVVLDIGSHFTALDDFEIELVTGPPPPGRSDATQLALSRGIPIRVVSALTNQIQPLANARAAVQLWRIMRRGNYDLVHTHSSVAGILGRLAARAAGVPVVVHHVHGWGLQEGMSSGARALYLTLERLCARLSDRLIVVARSDMLKGLKHRIGREEQYALIYNGIALEKFRQTVDGQQVRQELGLAPASKLVAMIGRLDEQKNPLDFIRAAAMVARNDDNVQFLLIGDGALRPDCERLIAQLQLSDRFFLLGARTDVSRILPIVALTALSSLWEGLPISILESMSAGKPIVANAVDGTVELVRDGETGFLVTPHRPAEMADRILYLLRNPLQCEAMGRTARRRSDDYSVDQMLSEIESVYRRLIRGSFVAPDKETTVEPVHR